MNSGRTKSLEIVAIMPYATSNRADGSSSAKRDKTKYRCGLCPIPHSLDLTINICGPRIHSDLNCRDSSRHAFDVHCNRLRDVEDIHPRRVDSLHRIAMDIGVLVETLRVRGVAEEGVEAIEGGGLWIVVTGSEVLGSG